VTNLPPGLEAHEPVARFYLLRRSIQAVTLPGHFCEFGVCKGFTAKFILKEMPVDRELHLFDSFEGLPEAWHISDDETLPAGHFKVSPPVFNDKRAKIHTGWFEETVATWARTVEEPLAFVHIDSDLYSSCRTVLTGIRHLLVPGTIIQFDEIQGYQNWKQGEWKAWIETGLRYEWVGRSPKFRASLMVVDS